MTDREALLAAIIANPDDDLPRLLYADCIEESYGEIERAEFIRVQCELARMSEGMQRPPSMAGVEMIIPGTECLLRRERELIGSPRFDGDTVTSDNYVQWAIQSCASFDLLSIGYQWRRGFIEHVKCPAADWTAHADAILAAHPVLEVMLTTMPEIHSHTDWVAAPNEIGFRQMSVVAEARRQAMTAAEPLTFCKTAWPRIRKWNLPPPQQTTWRNYNVQYTPVDSETLIARMRRAMENTPFMPPLDPSDPESNARQIEAAFADMTGTDFTS